MSKRAQAFFVHRVHRTSSISEWLSSSSKYLPTAFQDLGKLIGDSLRFISGVEKIAYVAFQSVWLLKINKFGRDFLLFFVNRPGSNSFYDMKACDVINLSEVKFVADKENQQFVVLVVAETSWPHFPT